MFPCSFHQECTENLHLSVLPCKMNDVWCYFVTICSDEVACRGCAKAEDGGRQITDGRWKSHMSMGDVSWLRQLMTRQLMSSGNDMITAGLTSCWGPRSPQLRMLIIYWSEFTRYMNATEMVDCGGSLVKECHRVPPLQKYQEIPGHPSFIGTVWTALLSNRQADNKDTQPSAAWQLVGVMAKECHHVPTLHETGYEIPSHPSFLATVWMVSNWQLITKTSSHLLPNRAECLIFLNNNLDMFWT